MKPEIVKIFDTTLRDGEQSPGCSMNGDEKLRMAHQLAKLNIDIIEGGFPIVSQGDFESVNRIALEVKGPMIAGLARANKMDIERCAQALEPAEKKRIHTFISSSDIHLQYQLKKTREEVLHDVEMAVKLAKKLCNDVEFSAMDATRSDRAYLAQMFQVAIDHGALTLNVPDTVGYTIPSEFYDLISYLKSVLKMPKGVCISVHCHNDLGLAVANSLAAIQAGARQVECTVNGIGERAGNASMEEIVMTLNVRQDSLPFKTNIKTEQIYPSSKLLSFITGISVQPNKAIVGDNAFAHESGIHQDGVLKFQQTYEIMRPESVGIPRNKLVLGKHSGRHAFRDRLVALGIPLEGAALEAAFKAFKDLSDRKKNVYDEDIFALVEGQVELKDQKYVLDSLSVKSGNKEKPEAKVSLFVDGKPKEVVESGSGPVDSVFKAIRTLTGFKGNLEKYVVTAITGETDAQGEVVVTLSEGDKTVRGSGAHTDIIVASAMAFLVAVNRLEYYQTKKDGRGV
ncbi:MAG TPA: 2-isopropylmalate synthase [Deltaproteobacteria bacterium]|nr:MAG: 2-isopropylmalate synthase [Deltaproteobacteria bacterium GWA2_45_12]HBF12949.1 2-isopropylmalate synthase [Deltaproteobacteria bacterium]